MSEQTENIPAPQDAPKNDPAPNTDTVDWQAEAEKWKGLSRKHEGNWQAVSKERDELKASTMTDTEKAIEQAKAQARTETISEVNKRIGAAELKAAAATAGAALPESLIALMDTSSVVNADGSTNTDLINQILSGLSPAQQPPAFSQNVGVGPQNNAGIAGQLTRDDLSRMSPAEIVKARKEGRLNHFLGG
jgi:membrane protein involved in colicin uptake